LLATRDPTLRLASQNDHVLYVSTSDPSGNDETYASIDLRTGEVETLGPTLFVPAVPDGGPERFTCAEDGASGTTVLTITDNQSGQVTRIDDLTEKEPVPDCPVRSGQVLVVWRDDGAGGLTLWVGPYDQLAPVATDLVIHRNLSASDSPTFTVLAAKSDAPDALGIFTIDRVSFATAALIAPALAAAAFADGASAGGPLVSAGLTDNFPILFFGDHFLYGRVMGTGEVLAFVGPTASPTAGGPARELALFPARLFPTVVYINQSIGVGLGPALLDDNGAGVVLRYWDDAAQRLVSCDLPQKPGWLVGNVTKDPRRLLFAVDPTISTPGTTGPLLLVSLDLAAQGGACSLLAAQDVASSAMSPRSTALFWVASPAGGEATLWSADATGTAARKLGSATSIDHVHFVDETRLELVLDEDLSWLDLREPVPALHYVAEKVFGDGIDLGDGRGAVGSSLVIGYELNSQDGSGMLGVVDRDTGAKRVISPAVVWYRDVAFPPVSGSAEFVQGVAYFVRGRNPSSQDGLWLATFEPGDLR
jgi:hypothetical protein